MSTLAQLKTVVYGYLQTSFPSVTRHPLLNNGTAVTFDDLLDTLFVQAANNARKHAELLHDFQCCECDLEGVIPLSGLGLSWDDMLDTDSQPASLRAIESAFVVNETTGDEVEVSIKRKKFLTKQKYDQRQRRTRYHQVDDCPTIIHHQRRFYCDPANDLDITLRIDGYRWLADYAPAGIAGVAATAVIQFANVPLDGDSIQIGNITYTFVTTPASSYDIAIPDNGPGGPAATPADAAEALRVALTIVSLYIPAVHPTVELASNTPGDSVYLVAKTVGAAGNLLTLTPSSGTFLVSDANFDGGIDEVPTSESLSLITDYFLTHGFAYMQWATIVELNHLIQRFVPRQEGSLSPPTKERDVQLQLLINNDCFASESGDYHDLRND